VIARAEHCPGLYDYLKSSFDHAVDLPSTLVVKCRSRGLVGGNVLSKAEQQRGHKGKVLSPKEIENVFAYIFRNDEDDDTVERKKDYQRLLVALGNPNTFSRSRQSLSQLKDGHEGSDAIELELTPPQFKKHVRAVVMAGQRNAKAVLAAKPQFD
jgi:hypothetical protein